MRSPQTIGEDAPRPGMSIFQRMFSVSLHFRGGLALVDTPVANGPRHSGQKFPPSCAETDAAQTVALKNTKILIKVRCTKFSLRPETPVPGKVLSSGHGAKLVPLGWLSSK